ncbi:hypothetical protein EVAR_55157_1 [Eumeta japonica]|uniref:Secreted protein n=1 Tax=Eumeta variegata TaxID=151549 RepID=A0A4C1YAZ8_EUMVA|nr:hypothetical protein EVAR_55157_1 [Eumeta japonica]
MHTSPSLHRFTQVCAFLKTVFLFILCQPSLVSAITYQAHLNCECSAVCHISIDKCCLVRTAVDVRTPSMSSTRGSLGTPVDSGCLSYLTLFHSKGLLSDASLRLPKPLRVVMTQHPAKRRWIRKQPKDDSLGEKEENKKGNSKQRDKI